MTVTDLTVVNTVPVTISLEPSITNEIVRLYEGLLGRLPDSQEISYYTGLIAQNASPAQIAGGATALPQQLWNGIAANFLASPEFVQGSGDLVHTLYANVLSRVPTADEVSYYAAEMANGLTGAQLAQDFINSPEYLAKLSVQSAVSLSLLNSAVITPGQISGGAQPISIVMLANGVSPNRLTVTLDWLADSFVSAPVDVSKASSQVQALDIATAAAGELAAGSAKYEWFQYGGNTYLLAVTNAGGEAAHTALSPADHVIELTGLYDLSTASFTAAHTLTL